MPEDNNKIGIGGNSNKISIGGNVDGKFVAGGHNTISASSSEIMDAKFIHETLPGYIYLDDESVASAVIDALVQLADEHEIFIRSDPPEIGSFKQRLKIKFRRASESETGRKIRADLERAIQLRTVDKIQSEVDLNHATGAAALIQALEGTESAAIQVGSTLVLKVFGKVIVRTLTPEQVIMLGRHPILLEQPASLLGFLQNKDLAVENLMELDSMKELGTQRAREGNS